MREDNEMRALWTDDDAPLEADLWKVVREERRLRRGLRARNAIEGAAALLVIGVFGRAAWLAPDPSLMVANGLIVAAAAWVGGVLALRGAAPEADTAASVEEFVQQHRHALLYQARLLQAVPWWYVAPFVTGIGMFYAVQWPGWSDSVGLAWWSGGVTLAVVVCAGAIWLNRRASAELRAQAAMWTSSEGPPNPAGG